MSLFFIVLGLVSSGDLGKEPVIFHLPQEKNCPINYHDYIISCGETNHYVKCAYCKELREITAVY